MTTLANRLTFARLLLTPVFAALVIWHQHGGGGEPARWASMGCFAAAAALDAVDGFVARWFHQCTELGAWLDPLADKILVFTALTLLTFGGPAEDRLPGWLWSVVTLRDALIGLGAGLLWRRRGRVQVRPRWTGKASTLLQTAAVFLGLTRWPADPRVWVAVAAALVTVVSGLQYLADGLRQGLAKGDAAPRRPTLRHEPDKT